MDEIQAVHILLYTLSYKILRNRIMFKPPVDYAVNEIESISVSNVYAYAGNFYEKASATPLSSRFLTRRKRRNPSTTCDLYICINITPHTTQPVIGFPSHVMSGREYCVACILIEIFAWQNHAGTHARITQV